MEKERLNEVVVKEENTNEEDRLSMEEKHKKKEKSKQKENNGRKKEGEEKSRKVKENRKKKVEEETQKELEENKKEKEKKQEVDMMGKKKNIEEEKKRKEFMKKKKKKVEQEKRMKELVNEEKEEYEKLKEEKDKKEEKNKGEIHKEERKRKANENNEEAEQEEDLKGRNIYPQFFKAIFPKKPVEKLRIPQAFNKFLENESLGVVSLKGPSGNTWHAKLVLDSEGFYFTDGWNEFFIDHNINLGDFLVFGYDGHSQFSIRIFDLTSCEKKSAFLACPSKDVTKKCEKGLMSIDTAKTLSCSFENYMGHKTMGGLQEDIDYVSNYAANTLEYKDQGQGVDVGDTSQHGERENMGIYIHDASDTSVFSRGIEKTIKLVDILKDKSPSEEFCGFSQRANDRLSRASFDNKRKASNRTKPRKSNIVLSCDKSMKDVPRNGSLRMNAEKVSPFQNSARM